MKRILSRTLTLAATLAALGMVGVAPAAAQAVADDTYEEVDDDDGGFDMGWLGLLGLLGLMGLKRRPDTHTHTGTTTHTPPPRV